MLLDIDTGILEADDHQPVMDLLTLVAKERHEWRPEPADALRVKEFVDRLHAAEIRVPGLKDWADKAPVAATDRGRSVAARASVRVTLANVAPVTADLGKPAVLVVENKIGDGGFVRAVAVALNDEQVVRALRLRWLRLCHCGGTGQMAALAADECQEFSVVVRVAMLIDSDRIDAATPSENDDKVRQAQAAGVPHVHMFTWRMVENYVPFGVWEYHFPEKPDKLKELRGMIPRQRGYTHLKKFFVGDRGREKMPSPLMPEGFTLTEADFAELGPDVVAELRRLLAMIREIL